MWETASDMSSSIGPCPVDLLDCGTGALVVPWEIDDVDDRVIEHQRVQCNRGAEKRDDFHFRLHPIDVQKRSLIGSFAPMDGQITSIDAQSKRDGV